MNAWPNAARPGEPADTARPWHWLGHKLIKGIPLASEL